MGIRHHQPFPKAVPAAALAIFLTVGLASAENTDPEALKFFETKIRPLLSEQCFKCHSEKKQKANLRLDNLSYILQGGDGGPALVQGNAKDSLIMKAISYEDSDLQMPPDNKLEANEIADLKKWVDMGAPWPQAEVTAAAHKPGEFSAQDRAWWAFQPVKKVTPPKLPNSKYVLRNELDKFIAARLQKEGFPQAPEADRHEFVRRAYYDLHGLAPTPEQVKAFVEDTRTDATEQLIDDLLKSPRYGERWAQHWLDLVRYGESDGYRQDAYRPEAWRYRDYVVKSFNDDKPYDRFVREQLAGDEIDPNNPEALIGTSYLRQTVYEYNERDAEGQRTTILNEITDVTGEVFLGLSFGCARCHDHKFDPILQKDYYRLQAFFAPMIWRDDLPLATQDEKRAYDEQMQKWETATASARARYDAAMRAHLEKAAAGAIKKFPDEVQAMVTKPEDQKTPYEKEISYFVMRQAIEEQKKPSKGHVGEEIRRELKAYEPLKPKPLPVAFVATDVGTEAPPTVMKSRKTGEQKVEPGFLSILDPSDLKITPMTDINSTGRRNALATWITRPDNPLTARVIVNRVWQQHFGRGLVGTSSDFGHLGEKPSHPELLDWLTSEFVSHGWSIKWLHRMIMNSATYRQTAHVQPSETVMKKDPENRLLWRMNPRRLDAEQARDSLLEMSGEINLTMGGPGEEAHQPRRAVYTRKIRNSEDEFLRSFDAPQGFQSVAQRDATTTALQSLLMINGDWPLQRAHAMAARLERECGPDKNAQITRAYELAYSREPSSEEITAAGNFLKAQEDLPEHHSKKLQPVMPQVSPLVDAKRFFGKHPLSGAKAVSFRPRSTHEKLRVQTADLEGDSFTIEAVIYLDSLYPDGTVRTIASRWNNDKASKGWTFGVTSEKSHYQPNNLIVQLCGDDFQSSTVYEVAASNIHIPLKTPYYVAAVISSKPANGDHQAGGTVTFYARNLADPLAPLENATVSDPVVGGYANPERALYLGGRDQDPRSLWDGLLGRVTITPGALNEEDLLVSKKQSAPNCVLDAQAENILNPSNGSTQFAWENATAKPGLHSSDTEALTDLCHVLINSNEFLYLQ